MAVEFKDLTVQVPAQVDDVMKLLVDLVVVLKQKGDFSVLMPDLIKAVEGIADLPNEAINARWQLVNSVAFHGIEIAKALLA